MMRNGAEMNIISCLFSRSAFFWFCNDERSKVKALNPEFGVGDIAKELGRRWSDVDPELKSKYEAMAEKDKARYDRVSCNLFIVFFFSNPPSPYSV
jgi:hypothetical protein